MDAYLRLAPKADMDFNVTIFARRRGRMTFRQERVYF